MYNSSKLEKVVGIAVFMLSLTWFYFPGEYILIANQDNSLFLTTPEYFLSFLDRPGGLLEYAGNFFEQFLRFRLIGALLLSIVVTSGYFVAGQVIKSVSRKKNLVVIGILTPALIVGMHNFYPHHIHHTLGFIGVMGLAVMFQGNGAKRSIFLIISVPVTYFFFGGFVWFFCMMVLAMCLVKNSRVHLKSILLITVYPVFIAFAGAWFVFLDPVKDLFIDPLPFGEQYGASLLPYIFVIWILVMVILARVSIHWKFLNNPWRYIPETTLSLAGILLILSVTYNRKNAEFFTIEKYAVHEDWDGLLAYSAQHPSMNLFGSFYTNLALANTGKLCSHLYNYPQPFGPRGLCFEWDAKGEILRRGSDFFWTIHFVNEAHHWAFESMIIDGFTRRNLKRLIQTELVRGNHKVADKYINRLGRTLFDKQLAGYYRKFLFNRQAIETDPELGPRLYTGSGGDFFTEGVDLEKNLRSLLASDPYNRSALEYLMALFLLEKRVDDVTAHLPLYLKLSGGRNPVLLDECLLVYKITHREENQSALNVSQQTIRRFEEYTSVLRQSKDQNEAARILYPAYKNTFWYYLNFSPLQ